MTADPLITEARARAQRVLDRKFGYQAADKDLADDVFALADALVVERQARQQAEERLGREQRAADAESEALSLQLNAERQARQDAEKAGTNLRLAVGRALTIRVGGEVKTTAEDWALIERAAIVQRRVVDPTAAPVTADDHATKAADEQYVRAALAAAGLGDTETTP